MSLLDNYLNQSILLLFYNMAFVKEQLLTVVLVVL